MLTLQPTTSSQAEESSNPGFPSVPSGNLYAKGLNTTNTPYPISDERTPVNQLPFPHPKWHVVPYTGETYEVISPIFEEYDPIIGYIGSVGKVRETVEAKEGQNGHQGPMLAEPKSGWSGYVTHPESNERSSIVREAKRARMEGQTYVGVSRSKRTKRNSE